MAWWYRPLDLARSDPMLTVYDQEHAITYLRMLDADAEGANWREVARNVLHMDPDRKPDRRGKPSRAILLPPNG